MENIIYAFTFLMLIYVGLSLYVDDLSDIFSFHTWSCFLIIFKYSSFGKGTFYKCFDIMESVASYGEFSVK